MLCRVRNGLTRRLYGTCNSLLVCGHPEAQSIRRGKTLFVQLMRCLPWATFARIVASYKGDWRVRDLPCTGHFRALALCQITGRESLRGIVACLASQRSWLHSCGFR